MPRRKAAGRNESPWLGRFVESDWPGRCSLERFQAWRSAQRDEASDVAASSEVRRAARRELQHPEGCPFHPLPDVWPTGWSRASDKTSFHLVSAKEETWVEEVENDSDRDRELRAAFEQWLQRLN